MKRFDDRKIMSICISAERVFRMLQDAGLLHFDGQEIPDWRRVKQLPEDVRIVRVDLTNDYEQQIVFHCESDQLDGYLAHGRQLRVLVPEMPSAFINSGSNDKAQ
jgi:hypothetical protein